jgi:hypothetical protein
MSSCCNTLSVSETDSVSIIRVWVMETELVSETLICVNHLIQVSARYDPVESYAIVCSQQWTADLNISRLYCTIQCKTSTVPVIRIPTALTCLCISTTLQNERMHEWMTLLIRYVHSYISFWYRNFMLRCYCKQHHAWVIMVHQSSDICCQNPEISWHS